MIEYYVWVPFHPNLGTHLVSLCPSIAYTKTQRPFVSVQHEQLYPQSGAVVIPAQ